MMLWHGWSCPLSGCCNFCAFVTARQRHQHQRWQQLRLLLLQLCMLVAPAVTELQAIAAAATVQL
jgi:hypothetical protein